MVSPALSGPVGLIRLDETLFIAWNRVNSCNPAMSPVTRSLTTVQDYTILKPQI